MSDKIRQAVLDLHRKAPLFGHDDECLIISGEHREKHIEERHEVIEGDFCCLDIVKGYVCVECSEIQGNWTTEEPIAWPCPTIRAITEAAGEVRE